MTSPNEPHSKAFSHINGSQSELLDRLAVAELCKGWPVYRDASEWKNFRSIFAKEATVWTTWSGALPIDGFIEVSKKGKSQGAFIMHRECGTLVELNSDRTRAVGKMKATITQRFSMPADQGTRLLTPPSNDGDGKVEYDVDCDCRFIFFSEKEKDASGDDAWKTHYVKLDYDKDKVVPADGKTAPVFTAAELDAYPEGYKYLGAAQARLGYPIDVNLPTPRNEFWWKMYECMEKWLDGEDPGLFGWKAKAAAAV
ncbi:hypothetical protein GE09DRAFT_981721 [Coniochaeta sp. 2T2.1]|nr:hypothetical protein GE09DRAFT_981721 [Coniochaeta sp. 2T2.1]